MPLITLETKIQAPIHVCFDLSRSIELHKISTRKTKEIAVAGITSGLIGLDEFVSWRATHFGIRQELTSLITAFDRPNYFCDEQIKGSFKRIKHDHYFAEKDGCVKMTDHFEFKSPFGFAGRVFNYFVLTR